MAECESRAELVTYTVMVEQRQGVFFRGEN